MPNPENLIPAKKGEIRNPWGRGKETPNRSTIARLVLEMKGKPPEKVLGEIKQIYPNFFKKKGEKYSTEFLVTLRIALRALNEGDIASYNAVMDSAYGKTTQSINLSAEIETEIKLKDLKDYIKWRKKQSKK